MDHFTAHRLCFECEVITPLQLNEHTGSAIRGAFYHALWNQFCMNHDAPTCPTCPLVATCPVAFLVSTLDSQSDRGANVPRPYTIQPPLADSLLPPVPSRNWEREGGGRWARAKTDYAPGETLTFGLTMFARALNLFPYVVLAIQRLENGGLGKRVAENGGRRGTFRVRRVWAENPLTGERREVLRQGEAMVQVPDAPITNQQIADSRWQMADSEGQRVTLELLTPLRLIENELLVKRITFRTFMQSLHRRLRQLSAEYSDTPLTFDFRQVMAQAEAVRVVRDETHWVELESYSTRLGRSTPLGGLVGQVTFEGELSPFWEWLMWGQFVHVGKDAVKGNGWYALRVGESRVSESASQRCANLPIRF